MYRQHITDRVYRKYAEWRSDAVCKMGSKYKNLHRKTLSAESRRGRLPVGGNTEPEGKDGWNGDAAGQYNLWWRIWITGTADRTHFCGKADSGNLLLQTKSTQTDLWTGKRREDTDCGRSCRCHTQCETAGSKRIHLHRLDTGTSGEDPEWGCNLSGTVEEKPLSGTVCEWRNGTQGIYTFLWGCDPGSGGTDQRRIYVRKLG